MDMGFLTGRMEALFGVNGTMIKRLKVSISMLMEVDTMASLKTISGTDKASIGGQTAAIIREATSKT